MLTGEGGAGKIRLALAVAVAADVGAEARRVLPPARIGGGDPTKGLGMTYEGSGGASRARAKRPRKGRVVQFPGTLTVSLPAGWLHRIDTAAAETEMTRAEWLRAALRRALDLTCPQERYHILC